MTIHNDILETAQFERESWHILKYAYVQTVLILKIKYRACMHAHAHPVTSRNLGNADQENDQPILKF